METQKASDNKSESNRKLYIILGIVGGLFMICTICMVIVLLLISSKSKPISSKNLTPSHYGVFVIENNKLMELSERELFSLPVESEMTDAEQISSSKPTIIMWRDNINFDYLSFQKLGQYLHQQTDVKYNVTPKDNGVFEITPNSSLKDGIYCLVQGDPLAVFLPGWCFRIGNGAN